MKLPLSALTVLFVAAASAHAQTPLAMRGSISAASLSTSPGAAGEDGPAGPVRAFYDVLLQAMKSDRAGFAGRRALLAPAIEKFFDFRLMTQLTVGPQWASLTATQQQQIGYAFTNFSIATYASRFDDYSGERFEVDSNPVPTGNGDEIVKSRLVQSNGEAVELDYLMHDDGGDWRAVDVYLSGTVSQLATQRSQFSSVLRQNGADGLVERLKSKTEQLSG